MVMKVDFKTVLTVIILVGIVFISGCITGKISSKTDSNQTKQESSQSQIIIESVENEEQEQITEEQQNTSDTNQKINQSPMTGTELQDQFTCRVLQLTNSLEDEKEPQMKPDGTKIAYDVGYEKPKIWIMNFDGSVKKFVTDGFNPSWHQIDNKIVFSNYYDIWIMDIDTKQKIQLTFDDYSTLEDEPSFSPDGSKIVFSSNEGISIMNVDGSNREQIIERGNHPRWNPNGNKIIYVGQEKFSPFMRSIWVYDVNTREKSKVMEGNPTAKSTTGPTSPSYNPIGDKIVYRGDDANIWVMNVDGSNKKQVISDAIITFGDEQYNIYDLPTWNYDDKILVTRWVIGTGNIDSSLKGNSDIYMVDCSRDGDIPLISEQPPTEVYEVSVIVDGDTLILENGETIRLIGINAPEIGESCYAESKSELEKLTKNKIVTLEKDVSDTDIYNRLLRYIYVDDTFVNLEIVRLGLAHKYEYGSNTKYSSQFTQAENEAKQNQGCLWKTSQENYIQDQCIYITTFHFNAAGNDNYNLNDEYVTFGSKCSYSIDMTSWTVKDETASHIYTFPSFVFQGGATFTLYTGIGTNTNSALYWGRISGNYAAIWNNNGDTLFLRDSDGNLVLTKSYSGY